MSTLAAGTQGLLAVVGTVLEAGLPLLMAALLLMGFAYTARELRLLLRRSFAVLQRAWGEAEAALADLAIRASHGAEALTRQVTAGTGGRFSLASVVVAVLVLCPLVLVAAATELGTVQGYYQALFSEVVLEFPDGGALTGGTLRALILVCGAVLIGYLAEALLNIVPFPLTELDSPRLRQGVRVALAVVTGSLYIVLVTTTADVAGAVYDGLAGGVCAERVAPTSGEPNGSLPAPADGFADDEVPPGGETPPAVGSAADTEAEIAACIRAWRGDGRGRWMQQATALTALHLNLLLGGWLLSTVVTLVLTTAAWLTALGLAAAARLIALTRFLPALLFLLIDAGLCLARRAGGWIVGMLRRLGLPLPLPDADVSADDRASAPESRRLFGGTRAQGHGIAGTSVGPSPTRREATTALRAGTPPRGAGRAPRLRRRPDDWRPKPR